MAEHDSKEGQARPRERAATKAERRDDERQQPQDDAPDRSRETATAVFKSQGLTEESAHARLQRERGYDPDAPFVGFADSQETGYQGQRVDEVDYSAGAQSSGEAARADLRAATRGRLGND